MRVLYGIITVHNLSRVGTEMSADFKQTLQEAIDGVAKMISEEDAARRCKSMEANTGQVPCKCESWNAEAARMAEFFEWRNKQKARGALLLTQEQIKELQLRRFSFDAFMKNLHIEE